MAQSSKARSSMVIFVSIGIVGLLIMALPTVFVGFFGMAPTWVAFIVDRTREKYATFCVAGLNACGVFPYLLDLWSGSHSINQAINVMTDPFSLIVMYSAAAFGWMMFITVPPVITSLLGVMAQKKVSSLRTQQRKLIEEWGESVARPPSRTTGTAPAAAMAANDAGRVELREIGSQMPEPDDDAA